jgi:anti-sigma B factor antagonist
MEIEFEVVKGYTEIKLIGRLDTVSSQVLDKTLTNIINKGNENLFINFKGLTYINSSGLRVFLSAAKRLGINGKRISLCEMQPYIKEVFDIAGFTNLFNFYATRTEVISNL